MMVVRRISRRAISSAHVQRVRRSETGALAAGSLERRTMQQTMTFTEHCSSQGVIPGARLDSVIDYNGATVLSVHEEDLYSSARIRARLDWPVGMEYTIYGDELLDWRLAR